MLPQFKPADAAELVRAEWHLGDRPISNMMSLLESKGVRILSLDHRYSDVDAFCFTRDGIPYIFVSTAKSGERQRFDLAHELGHLVMHSGDEDYPSSKEREKEAQDFASAFLLPASRIYTQGMHDAHLDRILEAKVYWGVSAMAMTYRLHDLGLLSDWQYRTAAVELTKRGYRAGEPGGITPERSQLLHKVFHSLGGYRMVQDIADTIGLRREDMLVYLRDLVMRAV
jgi:Zn-dependent peptidase ImmA (M78 family)